MSNGPKTTGLDAKVQQAIHTMHEAIEGEVKRLLLQWPAEMGEPCMIHGEDGVFLGLGPKGEIGQPGVVVLPARRVVLEVRT